MKRYETRFLPWLMERLMTRPSLLAQRRPLLRAARGLTLEIGFGTGAAIPAYPLGSKGVTGLVGLDPNPGMLRRAAAAQRGRRPESSLVRAGAEHLPFACDSFDTVVSNWTLCSIPDPVRGLREVRRVLRPDGRFLFLEHGLAPDRRTARWQRRLNPIHGLYAGGCRLDLPVESVLRDAGLRVVELERYRGRPGPKFLTQMYRGIAVPADRDVARETVG